MPVLVLKQVLLMTMVLTGGPVSIDSECNDDIEVADTNDPLHQTQLNNLMRMVEDSGYRVVSATPWKVLGVTF